MFSNYLCTWLNVKQNIKMASKSQMTSLPVEGRVQAVMPTVVSVEQSVPQGCIIQQSDGEKPWDNPHDLISHEVKLCISLYRREIVVLLVYSG